MEDFRSVLGEAISLEAAHHEANANALAAHVDANGEAGIALAPDAAPVPVQDPPAQPCIALLLHGAVPIPVMSMPEIGRAHV